MSQTLDRVLDSEEQEELIADKKYDSIISLTTNDIESKSSKGKKGRPVLHPFAGRITLLKEEIQDVLNNVTKFELMMEDAHSIDEDRAALLGKKLSDKEMCYTYCGPIISVVDEVLAKLSVYQNNDDVEDIEVNFKKKKIITDEKSPLYMAPIMDGDIVKKQEAYPNKIYGFVKVKFKS